MNEMPRPAASPAGNPALTRKEPVRSQLTIESALRPFPSVTRLVGTLSGADIEAWSRPNAVVRVEVETPPGEKAVTRVYTIRSFDPEHQRVEIDFVMHEDRSPAMALLERMIPGATVTLRGPRQHFVPNFDSGRPIALFADETAIPAVYSILSQWRAGARGVAWIETGDAAAFAELPRPEGLELHLLLRAPDEHAGATGRLPAAARALPEPATWSVWGACESMEARAIREFFADEHGAANENARVAGYWRDGVSASEMEREAIKRMEEMRAAGKLNA